MERDGGIYRAIFPEGFLYMCFGGAEKPDVDRPGQGEEVRHVGTGGGAYFVDSKSEAPGAAKQAAGEAAGTGPKYIPDAYKSAPEFKDADEEELPF